MLTGCIHNFDIIVIIIYSLYFPRDVSIRRGISDCMVSGKDDCCLLSRDFVVGIHIKPTVTFRLY